ncbi:hypothetical protein H6G00_01335 [Leptolyngbya sp. FACHB-541]|uniref:hypothetical protein n=1 Tax=Leptolyngbya sp. FACHB-541 TaxID=2692810 RepID=UPI00168986DD|nr:hypothetical protein [Leptolyngbya sp. FACHB-541]MBD1995273.1 hypothetical protein [Leptolyngbya sp. FACHB-541]
MKQVLVSFEQVYLGYTEDRLIPTDHIDAMALLDKLLRASPEGLEILAQVSAVWWGKTTPAGDNSSQ